MKRRIGYTGKKRFHVAHPKYGTITVSAPDEASAKYAAGYAWETDPTRIEFYAYCEVSKARPLPGNKKGAASAATLATPSELSADDQSTDNVSIAQMSDFSKGAG